MLSLWHIISDSTGWRPRHHCPEALVSADSPIPLSYRNGAKFNISNDTLYRMKLPPNQFVSLNEHNTNKFVFVTGASKNHFNESKDAIGSVQAYFPGRKIYYYDLGLNEDQKNQV